jgi:hypothetical protein
MISPIPRMFDPEEQGCCNDPAWKDTQRSNGVSERECSEQPRVCGDCCREDDDDEL